jgi:NitT/TauT family transport system permease protein
LVRRLLGALQGAALVLITWQVAAMALRHPALPPPAAALGRFGELLGADLWRHGLASLGRVVVSLAVSSALALPLGVALGRLRRLDAVLSPAVYLLYPVPKIALLPVVLLLFGLGNGAKIVVVSLVLFFQMLVAVRDAVRSVEPRYLLSIRSLGGGRVATFRCVLWPALLPSLLSALRVGSGTALAVLFFAETFFTRYGLGGFIVEAWMRSSYTDLFAGIIGLAAVGLLLFAAIDLAEHRWCRWRGM